MRGVPEPPPAKPKPVRATLPRPAVVAAPPETFEPEVADAASSRPLARQFARRLEYDVDREAAAARHLFDPEPFRDEPFRDEPFRDEPFRDEPEPEPEPLGLDPDPRPAVKQRAASVSKPPRRKPSEAPPKPYVPERRPGAQVQIFTADQLVDPAPEGRRYWTETLVKPHPPEDDGGDAGS